MVHVDVQGLSKGEARFRTLRRDALGMLQAALEAVDPEHVVAQALALEGDALRVQGVVVARHPQRVPVLAVGKAAPAMARAALRALPSAHGLVVTNQATEGLPATLDVIKSSHPFPDGGSIEGGRRALALAQGLGPGDVLLVLLSGGGSSLMELSDLSLGDLQGVYRMLLSSGLAIGEVNEVRRGLSRIKGGRLAEAAIEGGATVVGLVISDVVGDPLADVASGPTAPDASRGIHAREILTAAALWDDLPASARALLDRASRARPFSADPSRVHNFVVADNGLAQGAAAEEARRRGYRVERLLHPVTGEARQAGPSLLREALALGGAGGPAAVVAGGETTVRVRGHGRGGRSQEMVLSVVGDLEGLPVVFLSSGTDGVDGNTDAAGALADGATMVRARAKHLVPGDYLGDNNSQEFFAALGDLIVTGPTGTNVADVQFILRTVSSPK